MKERLDRLMKLLELKSDITQKAYQQLLEAQEQFKNNKLKHDQLAGYRNDYARQLETIGEQGTDLGRIRNRIDFITHLDAALSQLNGHLAQLAKTRAKANISYKEAKIAEEGIKLLVERLKKSHNIHLQRIEQKENDEYAQKQWYSNTTNE